MLFKPCMSFLLLLNIKEDILKNVGDQMLVAIGLHNVLVFFVCAMDVNGYQQLFGFPHFFPNILFCVQQERRSYRMGIT